MDNIRQYYYDKELTERVPNDILVDLFNKNILTICKDGTSIKPSMLVDGLPFIEHPRGWHYISNGDNEERSPKNLYVASTDEINWDEALNSTNSEIITTFARFIEYIYSIASNFNTLDFTKYAKTIAADKAKLVEFGVIPDISTYSLYIRKVKYRMSDDEGDYHISLMASSVNGSFVLRNYTTNRMFNFDAEGNVTKNTPGLLDETLTKQWRPADAKAVGDKLAAIEARLAVLEG